MKAIIKSGDMGRRMYILLNRAEIEMNSRLNKA